MRLAKLWEKLLGVERAVVEDVVFEDDEEVIVASVRPRKGATRRCGICEARCPGYDRGEGRRRWRGLDAGTIPVYLEADSPRVACPTHGVVVASVPWARHDARHTYAFDDQVAWLATHCSKSAVVELMRVAWRSVGSIVTRVVADARALRDPFDNLRRIGIDEISYKRGHKYLLVVVDHDTGVLVWAKAGRDKATVRAFFDELGEERCARITLVSADAAGWIADVVAVLGITEIPQTRSPKFPTPETPRADSDIRETEVGSPQAGGDEANQLEGAPPHDLKGRRRGSRRIEEEGVVHSGHRPAPRPGPQDDPGLPGRHAPTRRPALLQA